MARSRKSADSTTNLSFEAKLWLAADSRGALEQIADEKRVSIAWVIRDAITKYLPDKH